MLVTLAAILAQFYRGADGQTAELTLSTPIRTTIEDKSLAVGSIAPRKEVKIKSQVAGVLDKLLVKPGQWVKKGDLIAVIRLLADPLDVNEAQSRLDRARMEHQRARLEFLRQQKLYKRRLISASAFQDAELAYHLSQETQTEAERSIDLKLKGVSKQFAASSTRVYATVDGMVLDRPFEVGDFIIETNSFNEGTTIVTIADMNKLLFKGWVEEIDAGRLKTGMPLTVTVGALPDHRFPAKLEYISPKAKIEQGRVTFEIRAALFRKPDVFVRAGYSSTAEIVFQRHENVLVIPESYLVFNDGKPHIRVEVTPGLLRKRPVVTGLSDGLNIEIESGLSESDRIARPETGSPESDYSEAFQ